MSVLGSTARIRATQKGFRMGFLAPEHASIEVIHVCEEWAVIFLNACTTVTFCGAYINWNGLKVKLDLEKG